MSCLKRQKHLDKDQQVDRISILPDTLLCHILSLVPTKSAVATSILSRRWISLWTKVPVLDFSEIPISVHLRDSEKERFIRFVRKVLLHNEMPYLHRLNFEVLKGLDMNYVKSLLNSVLKREIWEIDLTKEWAGRDNVPMQLPTALFARERLLVLKLRGPFDISVPSSLQLPRLETLYLHGLKFVGQDVLKIDTSGYSSLRELTLEYLYGLKKIYIDLLTLNRLKTNRVENTIIAVIGPNVRCLDLENVTAQYDVSDLHSLIEARMCISADKEIVPSWAVELIRKISHVQTLRLAQSTVELFGCVAENELPIFPNLSCLQIQIAHSMFQMLKFAPKLMHLIVDVGIVMLTKSETLQCPAEFVPQCLLSLPTIEIRRYGGFENDTELIRYILKNATVLKEFKIHMHRASVKRERDAYKKLLCLPRFTSCEVVICSTCVCWDPIHF